MKALVKSSILPLLAIGIGVSLYSLSGGENFGAPRSNPDQEICTRDEATLGQLRGKPSLEEAVRFGTELRCLRLWPQLQAILDSLNHNAGSTSVSSSNDSESGTPAGGAVRTASSSPATEAASATLDDPCKHDETRLAEQVRR